MVLNKMKYFLLLSIAFIFKPTFAQTDLVLEGGSEFYISAGNKIYVDFITVNLGASFINQDPSGIDTLTVLRGDGVGGVLSIELDYFSYSFYNNKIVLAWATSSEFNNYGFEIERKVNSSNWEKIDFIKGFGYSTFPVEYSYTDKNPPGGGRIQYRLKQIDGNGNYEYSKVIEVEIMPAKFELLQNYPNPFNPSTKITVLLPQSSKIRLAVYNMLGELLNEIAFGEFDSGVHEFEFNSVGLASGIYIYRLESSDFIETKKMVVIK
jgi:hypothetical protein